MAPEEALLAAAGLDPPPDLRPSILEAMRALREAAARLDAELPPELPPAAEAED